MHYDLSALDHPEGMPRHVWLGERSGAGGDWVGTIRFASGMKPHDQVVEHFARTLGPEWVRELKIVVGTDEMWQQYTCYSQPPHPLPTGST
jgi:hypothetical protein